MAQDQQVIELPAGVWTQISSGAVTAISVQAIYGGAFLRATTGSAPDPSIQLGWRIEMGLGERLIPLTELATSISATAVFARPIGTQAALVLVDHE